MALKRGSSARISGLTPESARHPTRVIIEATSAVNLERLRRELEGRCIAELPIIQALVANLTWTEIQVLAERPEIARISPDHEVRGMR
ncbi:MAG: hypothetical protein ACOY3C_05860 [Bacillota bacterium]